MGIVLRRHRLSERTYPIIIVIRNLYTIPVSRIQRFCCSAGLSLWEERDGTELVSFVRFFFAACFEE